LLTQTRSHFKLTIHNNI